MKGNKKSIYICTLLSAACIMCNGCGSFASHNNADRGMSYLESHEYDAALESFQKALELGENKHITYRGLGIAYLDLGRYEEARDALLNSLSSGSGIVTAIDFDTNFYLAECYSKLGDYTNAIGVYDAILALHPGDISACYLRGVAYLQNGDHDTAYSDFTKAISLSPRDYDMMITIYKALSEYGYEEEGLSILQSALDKNDQFMTNYEKGQISFYLGNNADAQSYLELARNERDTEKAPVVLLLGQTGENQGDYNYAISVYKTFLEEESNHADIYNQLGICQLKMGDYEGAIASFQSGLSLDDDSMNQSLAMNEITAYEYAGDYTTALTLIQEYMDKYPDDDSASREYIFLSTRA
ncbi:MAG: tetratricopeptide repeat protein [Lachnospiraceae bacterium]|nr:tetratricopeptide repeat protein [Lachnospiraceae bacterium]